MGDNLRSATAQRLNDCNCSPAPFPGGGPNQTMPLSVFTELLWKTVYSSGYYSNKSDFLEAFVQLLNGTAIGLPGIIVQKGSIKDFPDIGSEGNALYIDSSKNALYYWQDKKGYCQIKGGGGNGAVSEEDVYDALDGKVVFSGGDAASDF